jgi:hypothetical protein
VAKFVSKFNYSELGWGKAKCGQKVRQNWESLRCLGVDCNFLGEASRMKKFIHRLQAKPRYNGCRLAVKKGDSGLH